MALFKQIFASDPNNPQNVATNGVISIFAPGTRTLIPIKTVVGGALANPLQLNALGFGPSFAADGYTQVAWEAVTPGQTFTGTFESYEGVLEQATAAKVEAAAGAAAEVAARVAGGEFKGADGKDGKDGANVATTRAAVANELNDPASPSRAVLSATYVPQISASHFGGLLRTRPKWVTTFQAGHGWTGSGTFDLNDTTVEPGLGSQSAKIIGSSYIQGVGLPSVDSTGKVLALMIRVNDITQLQSLSIRASSVNSITSSNYLWLPQGDSGLPYVDGEWIVATLNPGEATSPSGAPDAEAITSYRIAATAKAGAEATLQVSINAIGWLTPARRRPMISLTFDDTRLTTFTVAKRIMDRYGMPGTLYPIISRVDQPGYLSSGQIDRLYRDSGWEIGMHATTEETHTDLRPSTSEMRLREYAQLVQWNLSRGYSADSYALPIGNYNRAVIADARRFFASTRLAYNRYMESNPPGDRNVFRSRGVGQKNAAELIEMAELAAVSDGAHLVMLFHDLPVNAGSDLNAVSAANFEQFVDALANIDIDVVTVGDAMRGMVTPDSAAFTQTPTEPPAPVVTYFADDFAREVAADWGVTPQGALAWEDSGATGTRSVAGGRGILASSGSTHSYKLVEAGRADGVFRVTLSSKPSDNNPVIVLRAQDVSNCLVLGRVGSTDPRWMFRSRTAGAQTTLASFSPVIADGDVIEAELAGTTIKIRINGTQVFNGTVTEHATRTKFGVGTIPQSAWDDISLKSA